MQLKLYFGNYVLKHTYQQRKKAGKQCYKFQYQEARKRKVFKA